jgi:arginine N-succinyltransferase
MGPLTPTGKSVFWEAFGRQFTGLDYQTADKLSRENKEFIQQLFPPFDLYASLLTPAARRAIGAVGPGTRPVKAMLTRLGFRPVGRIDPFDGGPHYEAKLSAVTLVKAYRSGELDAAPLEEAVVPERLVAVEPGRGPHRFRAVRTRAVLKSGRVRLPAEAAALLGARPGDRLHLTAFEEA